MTFHSLGEHSTTELSCRPNDSASLLSVIILTCRYENQDIALHCGLMLRECLRHETLCKIILTDERFFHFFNYVEMSTFDISSDAFSTFKVSYSVGLLLSLKSKSISWAVTNS